MKMNRREAMALGMTSLASMSLSGRADGETASLIVQAHDEKLKHALDSQIIDRQSRWCGAVPDGWGLHHCGSVARLLRDGTAALLHPQSAFFGSKDLRDRMELAIDFLTRSQNADGNIDLLSTNFNSPPDTGFVVHNVGSAAARDVTVSVKVGERTVATHRIPTLEAPHDLKPRTVTFTQSGASHGGKITVVVDPDNTITEIWEENNRAVWSAGQEG